MFSLRCLQTVPLLVTLVSFAPSVLGSVIAPRASSLPCDYTTCPASSQYGTFDGTQGGGVGYIYCQYFIPVEGSPRDGTYTTCTFDAGGQLVNPSASPSGYCPTSSGSPGCISSSFKRGAKEALPVRALNADAVPADGVPIRRFARRSDKPTRT